MDYSHAAILADLDGTLFTSQGRVSPQDLAAIRDFIAGGGLFALATGREPGNVRDILPDLPINGPSILLNGASIYDFSARRHLAAHPLDRAAAADVLAYCRRAGLPLDMQVYTERGIVYVTPLETAEPGFLCIHQPAVYLPLEALPAGDWFKLVLLEREPGVLRVMRDYLREMGYTQLALVEGTTDVVKAGYYQEVLPRGVNKGTAVPDLRALPAYAGRTLFAAGDYWNDMTMLQSVDVPCAPNNAIPEIKAVCRHILPSNNDGPMAALIRAVIPAV